MIRRLVGPLLVPVLVGLALIAPAGPSQAQTGAPAAQAAARPTVGSRQAIRLSDSALRRFIEDKTGTSKRYVGRPKASPAALPTIKNLGGFQLVMDGDYGSVCDGSDRPSTPVYLDATRTGGFTASFFLNGGAYLVDGHQLTVKVPAGISYSQWPMPLPAYSPTPQTITMVIGGKVIDTFISTADCRPQASGSVDSVNTCDVDGDGNPMGVGFITATADNTLSTTDVTANLRVDGAPVADLSVPAGASGTRVLYLRYNRTHTIQILAGGVLLSSWTGTLNGDCAVAQLPAPSVSLPDAGFYDWWCTEVNNYTTMTPHIWAAVGNYGPASQRVAITKNGAPYTVGDRSAVVTIDPNTSYDYYKIYLDEGKRYNVAVKMSGGPYDGLTLDTASGLPNCRPRITANVLPDLCPGPTNLLDASNAFTSASFLVTVLLDGKRQDFAAIGWSDTLLRLNVTLGKKHAVEVWYYPGGKKTKVGSATWTPSTKCSG